MTEKDDREDDRRMTEKEALFYNAYHNFTGYNSDYFLLLLLLYDDLDVVLSTVEGCLDGDLG